MLHADGSYIEPDLSICPTCGKLMTTRVVPVDPSDYDGSSVDLDLICTDPNCDNYWRKKDERSIRNTTTNSG